MKLFNYTSKEKTLYNNRYKNLKLINNNIKGNVIQIKNIRNSENLDKNNNINRKKSEEYVILNQYFIYNKNISFIINQRNKTSKKKKSSIKKEARVSPQVKIIREKDKNNKEDDWIENQKINKMENKANAINNNNNKIYISQKICINKKKKESNSLSIKNNDSKSNRCISIFTKFEKMYGNKNKKLYDSKGFKEFRKSIKKYKDNKKMHKSLSCDQLNKKEIKNNKDKNYDKEKAKYKPYKFGDYLKNTKIDKDSRNNNYYIIDNFLSL